MPHNWITAPHRDWSVNHRDGDFVLHVTDSVRWRRLIASWTERALTALGHPCCWMGVGRIPPIGYVCRAILHWAICFDDPGSHQVTVVPLTVEQANSISPMFVEECLEVDAD